MNQTVKYQGRFPESRGLGASVSWEESEIHDRKGCSLADIWPQIPVIISAIFTVLVMF